MLKKLFFVVLSLFIVKILFDYIRSPDFQKYGDENKAQWTCYVNNFIGELNVILSNYERAQARFKPILERCPETELARKVAFKLAECLEKQGRRWDAMAAYQDYIEKYPATREARFAEKNFEFLKSQK